MYRIEMYRTVVCVHEISVHQCRSKTVYRGITSEHYCRLWQTILSDWWIEMRLVRTGLHTTLTQERIIPIDVIPTKILVLQP